MPNDGNNEFKGTTKEALRNLREDISELRNDCKESKKEVKELGVDITEIKARRFPLKMWGAIIAAFIGASVSGVASIAVAIISHL